MNSGTGIFWIPNLIANIRNLYLVIILTTILTVRLMKEVKLMNSSMRLKPHENYIVRNLEKNISIIQAFQDKISEQNVILEAEKINLLAGPTFDLHHQIFAILTPENKAEVMACVAIANRSEEHTSELQSQSN